MMILYSTEGCHLCEEAYVLLTQLGVSDQVSIVDIAFDEALFSRYGVTIPVLKLENKDAELNWPFDLATLTDWLDKHGISNDQ
ncbi:glutaredoxin family protein [Thaumasiovibrio subtropicus]|uniref:glutaredoxin family protein n=1 Tax=Thaumasiovibrio subtropicus TaxID=1891207 RepID=UPI001864442F|nr:glutaredoxin family protein [Thaumasiovibrio subtropicus]